MTLNYIFDGNHFEFTPSDSDIASAVCWIVKKQEQEQGVPVESTTLLHAFLTEYLDSNVQDTIFEQFREQLETYFEDDAREAFESAIGKDEAKEEVQARNERQRM